jgi:tetratricopeptide (TPR) repeat protein
MSADEPTAVDDPLAPLLAACDKALAEGTSLPDASVAEAPSDLRTRLERGVACIQMLRQVWPSRSSVLSRAPAFTRLGRFEIRTELGRGAFGVVFLAYDPQLGREIALKVPRPEALLTPELRARFVREAHAAAGLDHPNVVAVYEAGEVGPICYIASAYCPGLTLAAWLKERTDPVPVETAVELVATLAEAVEHAHRRGVVHRDLKPGNILLQMQNAECRMQNEKPNSNSAFCILHSALPKITDFGLAKLTAADPDATATGDTETGAVLGTPQYMAPEQATGKSREVGPAADIYALGVILYELLTGRPPFRGETPLDTLEQVRTQEPVPLRRLRPKLPRDVETVCLKCLQKDPAKRYVGASALAEDLRSVLAGRPVKARPVGHLERGLKWVRRRPAAAALLAITAAAAVTLLAVVLAYNARLSRANEDLTDALARADEQRRQANVNFRLAREGIDDYATKVSQDERLRAHDLEPLRRGLLQAAVTFYRKFVSHRPGEPAVRAEQGKAYARLGWLTSDLGSAPQAIACYRQARDIFTQLVRDYPGTPEYRIDLGLVLHELGREYAKTRKNNLAETALRQARATRAQLVHDDPTNPDRQADLAATASGLGVLYEETGRSKEAETAHREAVRVLAQLARNHPRRSDYLIRLAKGYYNQGIFYENTNRLPQAEIAYREAKAIRGRLSRAFRTDPEQLAFFSRVQNNLGLVYQETNRPDLARVAFREGLALVNGLVRDHPSVPAYQDFLASVHHNLGQVYDATGQPDRAEAAWKRARDLRAKLVRDYPASPDYRVGLGRSQHNLGDFYCMTGRPEQARVALDEARKIRERLVRENPGVPDFAIQLANTQGTLGLLLTNNGKPREALDWFARSVRRLRAVLRTEPRHAFARRTLAIVYARRAGTLNQLGSFAKALADWDQALALDDGPDHWRLRLDRAVTLARLGQVAKAVAEADAAAGQSSLPGETLYTLARVYGAAAAVARQGTAVSSAARDRTAERFAARGVAALVKAQRAGYFNDGAQAEQLAKDPDLAMLRKRAEFGELLRAVRRKK